MQKAFYVECDITIRTTLNPKKEIEFSQVAIFFILTRNVIGALTLTQLVKLL